MKSLAAEREQGGSALQAGRRDVIVVGAGVFGAWTAWHLLKLGRKVLLLDAWGPAHARASSGGESRMTRTVYGRDEIYTRLAWESLDEWRWLSSRSGLPIFHPSGVLPNEGINDGNTIASGRRSGSTTSISTSIGST